MDNNNHNIIMMIYPPGRVLNSSIGQALCSIHLSLYIKTTSRYKNKAGQKTTLSTTWQKPHPFTQSKKCCEYIKVIYASILLTLLRCTWWRQTCLICSFGWPIPMYRSSRSWASTISGSKQSNRRDKISALTSRDALKKYAREKRETETLVNFERVT